MFSWNAIRKGIAFKEENRHADCFELYEQACQAASALLPVDSDHRGRLQLSIARAESMSPDRGCAILRYAMDDVLRSGLRAGKIPKNYSMDVSKRADVVLSKPSKGITPQSSEEQLNSLVDFFQTLTFLSCCSHLEAFVTLLPWSLLQMHDFPLTKSVDVVSCDVSEPWSVHQIWMNKQSDFIRYLSSNVIFIFWKSD